MSRPRLPVVLPLTAQQQQRPAFVRTAVAATPGDGFHQAEASGLDEFRWLGLSGRLRFPPQPRDRYLELEVFSEFFDLRQELTVAAASATATSALVHGWAPQSFAIPAGVAHADLTVNLPFPPSAHPGDPRELAIRVRRARVHEDRRRHEHIRRRADNAALNGREMLAGATHLESTPPNLGIDLHGACNVKPPCVYCEWDDAKDQEGAEVETPFTLETVAAMGESFANSSNLVNCSIGEPFMMRDIDALLDLFGDRGKSLEMSTNGQILTDRNIDKLLGRDVVLYISLDAASAATYAVLRNDTFEKILANLRRLIRAKGGRQGLPRIYLVFMPMRANLHELDDFVRLCAELEVDKLVLRPLNATPGNNLVWDRGGYHYNYQSELLPIAELAAASARAAGLCRELGVELSDQMDFGGEARSFETEFSGEARALETPPAPDAPAVPAAVEPPDLGAARLPICTEPWKSLYLLRRGIRPCCHGGDSLGPATDHEKAWNGAQVQAIRRELAAGRFHDYCVLSPACPIVRRADHRGDVRGRQRALSVAWRGWHHLNDWTGNIPRRVWHRLRDG